MVALAASMIDGCASRQQTTTIPSLAHTTPPTDYLRNRQPLVPAQTIERYTNPQVPAIAAPSGHAPGSGGEGFVAPRGQHVDMPYDVLCINAEAQAAVEANVTYRDEVAQNNCRAAVRSLGAQAARDLALVDAAAATRENTLNVQAESAMDAVRSVNRTVAELREQMTSNSRFGVLMNVLVGLGGLVVGAGLAAIILGLAN